MSDDSWVGAEHDRMLASMLIAGTISEVNYEKSTCRVTTGDWTSKPLPWASLGAGKVRHWRPPSTGEQAMVMSPSGDPAGGFVFPGFYTTQHKGGNRNNGDVTAWDWPDDAKQEYDHVKHEYKLEVPDGGKITLKIGETVLEIRGDGVTLKTAKFDIDGPVEQINGPLSSNTVVLDSHLHKKVMAGMAKSGPPVAANDEE